MVIDLEKIVEAFPTARQRLAAERIRDLSSRADVVVGGYLPPERKLAELIDISRPTLRLVLKEMERSGAIRVVGKGKIMIPDQASQPKEPAEQNAVALIAEGPLAGEMGQYRHTGLSSHVHYGVVDALHAHGDNAFIFTEKNLRHKRVEHLNQMGVYGIVMLPGRSESLRGLLEDAYSRGIPVVVWGEEEWSKNLDRVTSDHSLGAYALTRALLGRGCKRILRYWAHDSHGMPAWVANRDAGHERAMCEAGMEMLPPLDVAALEGDYFSLIDTQAKFDTYVRLAAGYLMEHLRGPNAVDAIMALDDHAAIWLAAACRMLGRQPGKDIHITGYDNCADDTAHWRFEPTYPTFTVDKMNVRIGWEMVGMLKDRRNGKLPPGPQIRRVPSQLVIPAENREVPVDEFCRAMDSAAAQS